MNVCGIALSHGHNSWTLQWLGDPAQQRASSQQVITGFQP
jgi:hypothetical protein